MPEAGDANIEVAHHLSEHKEPSQFLGHEILEIAEVIVLALVAIITAWSGYQAALWTGHQAELYGQSEQATGSSRGSRHGRPPGAFVQRIDGGRVAKGRDSGRKETKRSL